MSARSRHAAPLLIVLVTLVVCGSPAERRTLAQDPHGAGKFLGSDACKKCHIKEHRSWQQTKMANAFQTLAPGQAAAAKQAAGLDPNADYRQDPACLRCHVVGLGQEGGFRVGYDAVKDPRKLLGVGCESCHGAGGNYVGPGKKDREYRANHDPRLAQLVQAGYIPAPGEAVCASCHNEDSPTFKPFDFETRKDEDIHEHF